MELNKRAAIYTIDAIIALIMVLGVVLFLKPSAQQTSPIPLLQNDLITVLSSIKISEINNSYVQQLIQNGTIVNLNQTVLEQIGEFYAEGRPEASTLANSILTQLNSTKNIGIYFNNAQISSTNKTPISNASTIWTARRIISGIKKGSSVTGFSSRAFLRSSKKSNYFYFGGYIGDGNITVRLDGDVSSVSGEAIFSNNFSLYLNNFSVGNFSPSPSIPFKFSLDNYSDKFNDNVNILEFKSKENLFIAGGFLRVTYNDSENISMETLDYFEGIDGLVNIYDSILIPGNLTQMEVFLHYNSTIPLFLTIANRTVFNSSSNGTEATTKLSNRFLSSIFNYSDFNFKTIPMRLGHENVSYAVNKTLDLEVFSVTDLSGSMAPSCNNLNYQGYICCFFTYNWCGSADTCQSCGGVWEDKITQAKNANKAFIDNILNNSNNLVGLVGYSNNTPESFYHNLSRDKQSLKNKVDSWVAGGTTCICCGINKAVDKMRNQSTPGKFHSIVVMSDGEANVQCPKQGTGDPKQDAIQAACDALNNEGIHVYSIGFGSSVDEITLQSIASCGGGSYYYGEIDELVSIYLRIAQEILNSSFREQTIISENISSKLFPDSYIKTSYNRSIPNGLVITVETPPFGNNISEGSFFVPNDTIPFEAKVTSYSGTKWTNLAEILNNKSQSWKTFFSLDDYKTDYLLLGDPFIVNIPTNEIDYGNNSVKISTGLNPSSNSSGGSPFNKVIYSLVKEISAYSPIVASAKGCSWTIEHEDNTNTTFNVPKNYNGTKKCYYTSSQISYNNNDAIDVAIYNLLTKLDLNKNKKVESKFSENDIVFSSVEVNGIPFTWDTEVQVRVWR